MENYKEPARIKCLENAQQKSIEFARLKQDVVHLESLIDQIYFPEPEEPEEYKDINAIFKYIPMPLLILSIIVFISGIVGNNSGFLTILGIILFICSLVLFFIKSKYSPKISKEEYEKLIREYKLEFSIYQEVKEAFEEDRDSIIKGVLKYLLNEYTWNAYEQFEDFKPYQNKKIFTDEEISGLIKKLFITKKNLENNIETHKSELLDLIINSVSGATGHVFAGKLEGLCWEDESGTGVFKLINSLLFVYDTITHDLNKAIEKVLENIDKYLGSDNMQVYQVTNK